MFLYICFKTFIEYLKVASVEIVIKFEIPDHHFKNPVIACKLPYSVTY